MSAGEVSKARGAISSSTSDVLDEVPHSPADSNGKDELEKPDHILVMVARFFSEVLSVSQNAHFTEGRYCFLKVNGLFGSTENWQVVERNLAKLRQASKILMVASNANLKLQTFDGINNCGKRLAKELRDCIEANPSLAFISVIGHSMGGLIARYMLGLLYDPETGLVAGLKPRHFISMATPHLGCGGAGPAQVPFIGWTEDFPLVGSYATRALQYWTNSFATIVMRKTGEQFFLLDGSDRSEPLLVEMVEDGPNGSFFSALEAFTSRTCYANSSGDHIVGWANSSIRHPDELPDLGNVSAAKGVVREDSLQCAFALPSDGQIKQNGVSSVAKEASRGTRAAVENGQATPRESGWRNASLAESSDRAENLEEAEKTMESSEAALRILRRLQKLPWCRIDTSFRGTNFPYFAHNLIQVTREWLNWEGESVVQHLAQHFASLEEAAACNERLKAPLPK